VSQRKTSSAGALCLTLASSFCGIRGVTAAMFALRRVARDPHPTAAWTFASTISLAAQHSNNRWVVRSAAPKFPQLFECKRQLFLQIAFIAVELCE
jgi:hypothetical protein